MPAAKYTQEQRDEALALYETHGPTAVQEQLGIAKGTVTGWAKEAGIRTVRTSRTREATEAKVADAQERIAALRLVHIGIAENRAWMLRDVQAGRAVYQTVLKGSGGSEHEDELGFIPPNDFRSEMGAAGSSAAVIKSLAPADTQNLDAAAGMLDRLVDGLQAAHKRMEEG